MRKTAVCAIVAFLRGPAPYTVRENCFFAPAVFR
jgi:hypothetical protein